MEYQRYIIQVTPQYYRVRDKFESCQHDLHPVQQNVVRLRCLQLHSLLERVDMIISSSTQVPLVNPDSIISNIRSILEFCQRPEMEYCVFINDFEFAVRGVVSLSKISNMSGPLGPLVSDDTLPKIRELLAFVIQSDKGGWHIEIDEGISEWVTLAI